MKTVSFLASGRGSNFYRVAQAIMGQSIAGARAGLLVTSNKNAGALDRAQELGFFSRALSVKEEGGKAAFERRVVSILLEHDTDLLVCAGYMKILSADFIREFSRPIMNIHPALLPAFPGLHAQKQALEYGVKVSGCTVHFVDEGVDTGPIILQRTVAVYDDDCEDSLSQRILAQEHQALPEAVELFCQDRLVRDGRRVRLL